MIEVEHPTLGVLEFPDGTSTEQIKQAIQKAEAMQGGQQPAQKPAQPQEEPGFLDRAGSMAVDALRSSPAAVLPNIAAGIYQGQAPTDAISEAYRRSPAGLALQTATGAALEPLAGAAAGVAAAEGEDARKAAEDVRAQAFQARMPQYTAQALERVGRGLEYLERQLADVGGAAVRGAGGGLEAQGVGAGAMAALPAAAAEVVGFGQGRRAAQTAARQAERQAAQSGVSPVQRTVTEAAGAAPGSRQMERAGARLAAEVEPDPQIVQAASDVGLDIERVPPEVVSGNQEFRGMAGTARSVPNSQGSLDYKRFLDDFTQRVQEIASGLGVRSRGQMNKETRADIESRIDTLTELENELYSQVDNDVIEAAGIAAPVSTSDIVSTLSRKLQEVNGDPSRLEDLDRQMLDRFFERRDGRLVPKQGETWVSLSNLRKELNAGVGQGRFPEASQGSKKYWAGIVSRQQRKAADELGVGEKYAAAMDATGQKKEAIRSAERVLGKDLKGSDVGAKMQTAFTAGEKGDMTKMISTLEDVPADLRGDALRDMIFDVIIDTGNEGARVSTAKFNRFYNNIISDPEARRVFYANMDADTRKAFDSIGKLNSAVKRANEDFVATGRLMAADQGMQAAQNAVRAMVRSMMSMGARRVGGEAAGAGVDAATSGARRAQRIDEAAADVLASPEFRAYAVRAAKGEDVAAEAERLSRTSAWRRFLANSPESTREAVNTLGVTGFLTQAQQEDEQ